MVLCVSIPLPSKLPRQKHLFFKNVLCHMTSLFVLGLRSWWELVLGLRWDFSLTGQVSVTGTGAIGFWQIHATVKEYSWFKMDAVKSRKMAAEWKSWRSWNNYRHLASWIWEAEVMKLYSIRFKIIIHAMDFQFSQNVPWMRGISIKLMFPSPHYRLYSSVHII